MRNRLFSLLARLVLFRPWLVIVFGVVLAGASIFAALHHIKLNADLDDLVSEDLDYHRQYKEFLRDFGDFEYLYVVVEVDGKLSRAKRFVDDVTARLKNVQGLREVISNISSPVLEKSFLLYLDEHELDRLSTLLSQGSFSAVQLAQWSGFHSLFEAMVQEIKKPVTPQEEETLRTSFTFLSRLLDMMFDSIRGKTPYTSELQHLFFGGEESFDPDGYLRSGDLLFVLVMPEKDFTTLEVIAKPLADIRNAIAQTLHDYPDIHAGLTGRPVLAADELATTDRDMQRATIIAIILIAILFVIFFRSAVRSLAAVFSLLVGIAWTFGCVALVYGELTLLSVVFSLILVSAAIEYGIHFVARYQEELARGTPVEKAITGAMVAVGRSNVTSSLTTAAAFATIAWTDFTALAELGVIAAGGILLCFLSQITLLPALLVLSDRKRSPDVLMRTPFLSLPIISRLAQHPRWLLFVSIIVSASFLPFIFRVSFDHNLLNLQARGLESVHFEHLILEKSKETTWFAHAIASSPEEALKKAPDFRRLESVRKVDDISRILPAPQEQKLKKIANLAPAFESLSFAPMPVSLDREQLEKAVKLFADEVSQLQEKAFAAGHVEAVKELSNFEERLRRFVEALSIADDAGLGRLLKIQQDFLADLQHQVRILQSGMHPVPITLEDIPEEMKKRFVAQDGRSLLTIYPKENIWEPEALERFVADVRNVDPSVVGTPIEVYESAKLMRETFFRSALAAFVVILLLVWLDFRSLRFGALAVLPLVVGIFWLLGCMGLFGISFNMANFFAIPILIGIGVDSGVHLAHRIRLEKSFSAIGSSTGRGVVLTVLANAVGFGLLLIAAHRGLASLGMVMAVGSLCCLVAAFIVLPAVGIWSKKYE